MHVLKKETAPRYVRPEGITSYLLASPRTSSAEYLTTTLAVIQAGGEQRLHSHRPEQVYFIHEGRGLMTVGDGGWVDLLEPVNVRAGEAFIAVPEQVK